MPQPALQAHPVPRFLGLLLGLVTGTDFLSSLSLLIAHEAVREGLGASAAGFVWIMTTYAAAGLVMTPGLERLARRWHYRDLLAWSLGLFVLGSGLAAASDSLPGMLAARVVQGLGGGSLFTLSRVYLQLAVPTEARPLHVRGFILGLMGSTAPMAWLTAVLVQETGWRSVFLLQGGVALLVLLPVLFLVKAEHHTPRALGRLNWGMIAAFAAGALLLLHGLEDLQIERLGLRHLLSLGLATLLIALATRQLLRDHDPLLDPRALGGRRYLAGLAFYGLYYLINGAASFIYPKLLEQGAGLSLPATGALLSLSGAATALLLPVYFVLTPVLGDRRRLMAAGFALAGVALIWMSLRIEPGTPAMALLLPMLLKGLFPVLCVVQIAGLTYREVAHEDFAHAYAVKNVMRQIVIALAAGLASQGWQARIAHHHAVSPGALDGLVAARAGTDLLLFLALLCLLAAPLALRQDRLR